MGLSSEEIDLIEKVVDGSASAEEERQFDERCSASEAFKKEADFQLTLTQSLRAKVRAEQKQQLLEDYQKFKALDHKQSTFNRRNFTAIGIAASLLIVSFITFFTINQSSESLYEAYYTPYSGPVIVRGESTADELAVGMKLYKKEQYAEALPIFEKLLNENLVARDELNLMIGICNMELGNTDQSRLAFQQVSLDKFKHISDWYYTMSLLKDENFDEAKANVQKISNSNSPFRHKAKELAGQLP